MPHTLHLDGDSIQTLMRGLDLLIEQRRAEGDMEGVMECYAISEMVQAEVDPIDG